MLTAIVAHSEEVLTDAAAEELIEQCTAKLAGAVPKAGLLFAAIEFEHQVLLDEINRAFPGLALIGCTTDGEISSDLGFREDSATLILFTSDTVDITSGIGRGVRANVEEACQSAVDAARARTDKPARLCISMPEGLDAEGHIITTTLQRIVGQDVPLFGAQSADQWKLTGTFQFCNNEVLSDAIPVLLFSGDFRFSYGVAFGWHQVGEVGRVTRAAGATVHEIDGQPAIDFYRKYLGPGAKPSGELPLAILNDRDTIEYLRTSFGTMDEATGSVDFLATVPEGSRVRLAIADRDALLTGCAESLAIAKSNLPDGAEPVAALVFSCAVRKILLGTRTQEELEVIRGNLGTLIPICGFYGYGEISPHFGDTTGARFHNQSFVSLLIAD